MREKVLLNAVLCFLRRENEVLLAKKPLSTGGEHKIGEGKWNGYGGVVEPGESLGEAITRELKEESGLVADPGDFKKSAIVDFHNTKADGKTFICRVHVYLLYHWQGKPIATKEMVEPTWFKLGKLPLTEMMPADRIWLPPVLRGRLVNARAWYAPRQEYLRKNVEMEYVDSFPDDD